MKNLARCLTHTLHNWSVPILAIAIVLGMCCSIVVAQSGAGSIQGTITDSTGAVIQSEPGNRPSDQYKIQQRWILFCAWPLYRYL